VKLKRGEGPLHPHPKGWGIRDPLRSLVIKLIKMRLIKMRIAKVKKRIKRK
jgi:hypothetical protein